MVTREQFITIKIFPGRAESAKGTGAAAWGQLTLLPSLAPLRITGPKVFRDVWQLKALDFYARKQNASCIFAIVWASVRLSVRPSVTLVSCIKTVQARITKSSP